MAAEELSREVGVAPACAALGVSRATFYRRRLPVSGQQQPRSTPARALREDEREAVLDVLCSERFVDRSPGEVVATLLDEEEYLCSERTMYRILESEKAVRERRDQLRRPMYEKPELVATAPNQVWSWDITKLKGPRTWTWYYLYVVLDVYSRYVVGWLLAERESTALATRLIEESCEKQGVAPGSLVLHSDRGSAMTSQGTAQLLAQLGVLRSLSRPSVSNDNPFSEAHFKTLKYHPGFPRRFGSLEDARAFCRRFFTWYHREHKHSALSRVSPEDVHYRRDREILARRDRILETAFGRNPERFVNGKPSSRPVEQEVWINRPHEKNEAVKAH
jgi:putative transposase